jgi:hypothetical protein
MLICEYGTANGLDEIISSELFVVSVMLVPQK